MSSLFCRHNRFTADCPICSKGTVLDSTREAERRPRSKRAASPGAQRRRRGPNDARSPAFAGPYAAAGPYERGDGSSYEVRLERVPGGIRLASWAAGRMERRAPELRASDLVGLVATARERELLPDRDLSALARAMPEAIEPALSAEPGASPGRAGDMREELRVEPRDHGMLRIARWLLFPSRGWELQDAAPMLPASRYAEALGAFFSRTPAA